jgi:hypothetical protein
MRLRDIAWGLLSFGLVAGPMTAHAQLTAADGGVLVYDAANNLTWVSNANLFASQYGAVSTIITDANSANGGAGLPSGIVSTRDFFSNGTMTWQGSNAWVNYLNVTHYGGSSQWALPTAVDQNSGQMVTLFFGELGGTFDGSPDFLSTLNSSAALFSNLQNSAYWSGTAVSGNPQFGAWYFSTTFGVQSNFETESPEFALAVHAGPPAPTYSCLGFDSPFNVSLLMKQSNNRVIPIKATLEDQNGVPLNSSTIAGAAPVVNISFTGATGPAVDETAELLPAGESSSGNSFTYNPSTGEWQYNMASSPFTASGTYTVTLATGDATKYGVSPTCSGTFVRP